MDFGDYQDHYYSVQTTEGEAIAQLLSGYIDIILKARRDAARIMNDDGDTEIAVEEHVAPTKGMALQSNTHFRISGGWAPHQGDQGVVGQTPMVGREMQMMGMLTNVEDAASAIAASGLISNHFFSPDLISALGPPKGSLTEALDALSDAAIGFISGANSLSLSTKAKFLHERLLHLLAAVHSKAEGNEGEDSASMLEGSKLLSEAIGGLLQAATELEANPKNPHAIKALHETNLNLQQAQTIVQASCSTGLVDAPSLSLVVESAKHLNAVTVALASLATVASPAAPATYDFCKKAILAASNILSVASTRGPGLLNNEHRDHINACTNELISLNKMLCSHLRTEGVNPTVLSHVEEAGRFVEVAASQLLDSCQSLCKKGQEPHDFITPVADIQAQVKALFLVLMARACGCTKINFTCGDRWSY